MSTLPVHPFRRRALLGLLAVFTFAIVLRWGWPGVIDFKLDEASASRLALAWAQGGKFALYGVTSSTGVPTPPNAVWVLALPYFFGPDPLRATAWLGLLSALSVAVGYWLTHRYFGLYAALVTGVLHAASPWSVYQARKAWTPGAQPLFAVLTVATGVLGFIENRPRWQAVHVFTLAFAVGVHFSSLPLALVTLCLMLMCRRRIRWRMIALGVLAVVIVTIPFVIGIIREPNIIMTDRAAVREHHVTVSSAALELTFFNVTGTGIAHWGVQNPTLDHPIYAEDEVAGLLTLEDALLILSVPVLAVYDWRRRATAAGKFGTAALVWLFSYTVMFTVQWVPLHPHYYIALWPAPYVVIGAGLWLAVKWIAARSTERFRRLWPGVAVAGLLAAVAIAGAQVFVLHRFYTFAGAHFTSGDFGMPLGLKMQGAQAALDLLHETGASEIIVVGEGDRPYQYEDPGGFEVMLYNAPHRFVDSRTAVLLPDHPAVILLQPRVGEPARSWYTTTSEVRARLLLRADEGEYVLLLYDPAGRDALLADFTPAQATTRLANGVRIVGHRWVEGAGAHIDMAWKVESAPSPADDYHFTVYAFNPQTQTVLGQVDGPSHWAAYWRAGDVVINWFAPPAVRQELHGVQLRAAMYTYPGIERVPAVDAAGAPVGDSALLDEW